MTRSPDIIRRLHDQWANGRVGPVLNRLHKEVIAADDRSGQLALRGMEARFLAHSGFLRKASPLFRQLSQESLSRVSPITRSSILHNLGYYEYEIKRNFSKAETLLAESLKLARKQPPTQDTLLMMTASCWRIASIAQATGRTTKYWRFIDEASELADGSEDNHMKGVVLLARGHRSLAMGLLTDAQNQFLEGLFCVGYDPKSPPHFLHGELILGLLLTQVERLQRERSEAVLHSINTLVKIDKVLGQGKGWVVTPYRGGAKIAPSHLLATLWDNDEQLARAKYVLSPKIRDRVKNAFANRCVICDRTAEPTIDHIIPTAWGGTHWEGNLRLLCKPCNSSRKHYFTCIDMHAYLQLSLRIGDDMISV